MATNKYHTDAPAIDSNTLEQQEQVREQAQKIYEQQQQFNNLYTNAKSIFLDMYPDLYYTQQSGAEKTLDNIIAQERILQREEYTHNRAYNDENESELAPFEFDINKYYKMSAGEQAEHQYNLKTGEAFVNDFYMHSVMNGADNPNDYFDENVTTIDRKATIESMKMQNEWSKQAGKMWAQYHEDHEAERKNYEAKLRAENPNLGPGYIQQAVNNHMGDWEEVRIKQMENDLDGFIEGWYLMQERDTSLAKKSKSNYNQTLRQRLYARVEELDKASFKPTDLSDPYFSGMTFEEAEKNLNLNKSYNHSQHYKNAKRAREEILGRYDWKEERKKEAREKGKTEEEKAIIKRADENMAGAISGFKIYAAKVSQYWKNLVDDPEGEYEAMITDKDWEEIMVHFMRNNVMYGREKAIEELTTGIQDHLADRNSAWRASRGEDDDGDFFDWGIALRNIGNTINGFGASFTAALVEDVESLTGLIPSFVNAVVGEFITKDYADDGMNIWQKTYQNIMEDRYGLFQMMNQRDLTLLFGMDMFLKPEQAFADISQDPNRYSIMDWASGLQMTGAWTRERQEQMQNMGLSYLAPPTRSDAGKIFNSNIGMQLFTNMGFMAEMMVGGWAKSTALLKAVKGAGAWRLGKLRKALPTAQQIRMARSALNAERQQTLAEVARIRDKMAKTQRAIQSGKTAVAITEPIIASHAEAVTEAKITYDETIKQGTNMAVSEAVRGVLGQANGTLLGSYQQATFFGDTMLTPSTPIEVDGQLVETYMDGNGNIYTVEEAEKKFGKKEDVWFGADGTKNTAEEARSKAFDQAYNNVMGDENNFTMQLRKVAADAAVASTYDYMFNLVLLTIDNGLLGTCMQTRFYKDWLKNNRWARENLPEWITQRNRIGVTWTGNWENPFMRTATGMGIKKAWEAPLKFTASKQSLAWYIMKESTVQGWEEGMQRLFSEGSKAAAFENIGQYIANIYNGNAPDELGKIYDSTFGKGLYKVETEILNPAFWQEWLLGQASFFLLPGAPRKTSRYNEATGQMETTFWHRGSKMEQRQKMDKNGNLLFYDENGNETTRDTGDKVMENYEGKKESILHMLNRMSFLKFGIFDAKARIEEENEYTERVVESLNKWASDEKNITRLLNTVTMMQSMYNLEQVASMKGKDADVFQNAELEALVTTAMALREMSGSYVGRAMLDHIEALANMEEGDETAQAELKLLRNAIKTAEEKGGSSKMGLENKMSDSEMIANIKKNAKRMLEILTEAEEESGKIDEVVGRIDDLTKQGLIYGKILREDLKRRLDGNEKEGDEGLRAKIQKALDQLPEYNLKEIAEESGLSSQEVRAIARFGSIKNAKKFYNDCLARRAELKKEIKSDKEMETADEETVAQQEFNLMELEYYNQQIVSLHWTTELDESRDSQRMSASAFLNLDEQTRGTMVSTYQSRKHAVKQWHEKRAEYEKEVRKKVEGKKLKGNDKRRRREKEIAEAVEKQFPISERPQMTDMDYVVERVLSSLQASNPDIVFDIISAGRASRWLEELEREYTDAISDPKSLRDTLEDIVKRAANAKIDRLAVVLMQHDTYESFVSHYIVQAKQLDKKRLSLLNQRILRMEKADKASSERFLTKYATLQYQASQVRDRISDIYGRKGDEAVTQDLIESDDYKRIEAVLNYCIKKGINILDEGGHLTEDVVKLLENPTDELKYFYKVQTKEDWNDQVGKEALRMMMAVRTRYNEDVDRAEEERKKRDTTPVQATRDPKEPASESEKKEGNQYAMLYSADNADTSIATLIRDLELLKKENFQDSEAQEQMITFFKLVADESVVLKEIIERHINYAKYMLKKDTLDQKERDTVDGMLTETAMYSAIKEIAKEVYNALRNGDRSVYDVLSTELSNIIMDCTRVYLKKDSSMNKRVSSAISACMYGLINKLEKDFDFNYTIEDASLPAAVTMKGYSEQMRKVNDSFVTTLLQNFGQFVADDAMSEAFDLSQGVQNYEGVLHDKYEEWGIEQAVAKLKKMLEAKSSDGKVKVYFVHSDELSQKVEQQMNEAADKAQQEGRTKRRYNEKNDAPVVAVIVSDNGPLTVLIDGEETKVQPIGFITSSTNQLGEGDRNISQKLRKCIVSEQKSRTDVERKMTYHVLKNDDGKEVATFAFAVAEQQMDDKYRRMYDDDEAQIFANPNRPIHNARNLLRRLAFALAYRGKVEGFPWASSKFTNGVGKSPFVGGFTVNAILKSFDKKSVDEIMQDEANDPLFKVVEWLCDHLTRQIDDADGGRMSLVFDDNNHHNTNVWVLGMDKTLNADGKKWIDVLRNGKASEIVNFNSLTSRFALAFSEQLFGDQGLVKQLQKAKDKVERAYIINNWNTPKGKNNSSDFELALNNFIHLASSKHYSISYDEDSHTVSVSINVGNNESLTLFKYDITKAVPEKNDVNSGIQAYLNMTEESVANFLKTLLVDENDEIRSISYEEDNEVSDYGIAHWQVDYNNFNKENPNGWHGGKDANGRAIMRRMLEAVIDGLIYMRTYSLAPSVLNPALYNPFDSDNNAVDYDKLVEQYDKREKEVEKSEDQLKPETPTKQAASAADDTLNSNVKYKNQNEAVRGLSFVDEDGKKAINPYNHFTDPEQKSVHLTCTQAVYGAKQDEQYTTNDGESKSALERPQKGKSDRNSKGDLTYSGVSKHIGSTIDEFVRGVIKGKIKSTDDWYGFPNYPDQFLKALAKKIEAFRDEQKKKGITLYNGIRVYGKVKVRQTMQDGSTITKDVDIAGELDIVGVDKNGTLYIYDIKTMRSFFDLNGLDQSSDGYKAFKAKMYKYSLQVSLYRTLLMQKGFKVSDELYILPIQTHYEKPNTEGGNKIYRDNANDAKNHQLYDEDGNKISLSKDVPSMKDLIKVKYSNIGTVDNPLLYEKFTEREQGIIDGTEMSVIRMKVNEDDELIPEAKQDTPPTIRPKDDKVEGTDQSKEQIKPEPKPTEEKPQVQTTKTVLSEEDEYILESENTNWEVTAENIDDEKTKEAVKACAKEILGLKADASDEEFQKAWDSEDNGFMINDSEQQNEKREKLISCIKSK